MIDKFTIEAEEVFIAEQTKDINLNISLGQYDADNETFFLVENHLKKDMLLHVPVDRARNFRNSWGVITYIPKYFIENGNIDIAEIDFKLPDGEFYKYSGQASLRHDVAQISYNFAPIEFNLPAPTQTAPRGEQNIGTVNVQAGGMSDVAVNIPTTGVRNDKTFAVIIANENYRR